MGVVSDRLRGSLPRRCSRPSSEPGLVVPGRHVTGRHVAGSAVAGSAVARSPGIPRFYLGLLGAALIVRLGELGLSAANERRKRSGAARGGPAGHFGPMVGVHAGLFTLPLLEISLTGTRARHARRWLLLWLAATGLRWWSMATLGRQWNVRGVVAPDLHPVTSGPYRLLRHPNYLAVMAEMLALPMIGGAWRSALLLSTLDAVVLWDRIREEERRLDRSPAYRRAFAGRKRLIPGIF